MYLFLLAYLFTFLGGDEISITLEHAVTENQQSYGLMNRKSMPFNHGMTFNYPAPRLLSFWMYQTQMDLSLAFLDENKVIREIHELKSYPEINDPLFFLKMSITSSFPASYALEMNKDWFVKNGVHPGDMAVWSIESSEGKIIKR